MNPKSNTLFHFTKNAKSLKGILKNGFLPRYCREDIKYLKNAEASKDCLGYPMVCFCDIPLSRISEHTKFYGSYGLGMTKEWGIKNALAPILYTPEEGVFPDFANFLLGFDMVDNNGNRREDLINHFWQLISMIKPLRGEILNKKKVTKKKIEKDFHQENEWRFVPKNYEVLLSEQFEGKCNDMNSKVSANKLVFSPTDIKYIFVKREFDIRMILDFIQNNLDHFPPNDKEILATRIISLDTLARDV